MHTIKSRGGLTQGSDSVRILWIHSMHWSNSYCTALSPLTSNVHVASLQHHGLTKDPLKRFFSNFQKIRGWINFCSHDPFDSNHVNVLALDSGFIACEEVNCEQAEEIGQCVQEALNNVLCTRVLVKHSQKAI